MTTISWTRGDDGAPGKSWNPIRARNKKTGVVGWFCVPVHDGCKCCYAGRMNEWRGNGLAYKAQHLDDVEFFLDEETLREPLTWRAPRRVFVCSMTDLYAPWVREEWLDRIKAVEALTPHTYIELTKRPDRMAAYAAEWFANLAVRDPEVDHPTGRARFGKLVDWSVLPTILPNVWGGASISTQPDADAFVPIVQRASLARRILSIEPLLGPVKLKGHLLGFLSGGAEVAHCANCGHGHGFTRCPNTGGVSPTCHRRGCRCPGFSHTPGRGIDWVIAGLESGRGARPGELAQVRAIIADCAAAGVPCFVKQLGGKPMLRIDGKLVPLKLKDRKGEDPAEWPAELRVRQFPASAERRALPAQAALPLGKTLSLEAP